MARRRRSLIATVLSMVLVAAGCSSQSAIDADPLATTRDTDTPTTSVPLIDGPPASIDLASVPRGEVVDFGPAPAVPEGPLASEIEAAITQLFSERLTGIFLGDEFAAIDTLGASGDPRVGWLLSDLMRVTQDPGMAQRIANASTELIGVEVSAFSGWPTLTNRLIAWDIPAPPNYLESKANIYTSIVPEWEALFDAEATAIDWRYVSWGGVRIDDRPFDETDALCNCIPAADNPQVESASDADWLDDDAVIFGVVINGEARAYPRRIMEVREMVNDTLGGRDFAMPYCTLCGSAQVWFTDNLPDGVDRPVLRTSGLLSRSNKVMYDLNTFSIFDTFLGTATTGPLAQQGVELDGHTVVTSTWSEWVADHPNTTVLIEDLALGRDFDFRNGRDADGPIFPIGDVDPRLPVQEDVLGVVTQDGTPLAVHVASAVDALARGEVIEIDDVRIVASGDGIRAIDLEGNEIAGHQAFWFAWSQFYEDTELWPG